MSSIDYEISLLQPDAIGGGTSLIGELEIGGATPGEDFKELVIEVEVG